VAEPPTSITVSPNGEYIATAHASTNALCVWANRAFFSSVLLTPASDSPTALEMPVAAKGGEAEEEESEADEEEGARDGAPTKAVADDDEDEDEDEDEENEEDEGAATSARLLEGRDVPQMATCITLSSLPASHMRTILHLDTIQQRNLPKQPPKAPERAPFFLPTTVGVERAFAPLPGAGAAAAGRGAVSSGVGKAATHVPKDGPKDVPMDGWIEAADENAPDQAADENDEWAAAAAAAGRDEATENEEELTSASNGLSVNGPSVKRPRTSRLLSSRGRPDLSPLQTLIRAADEAHDKAAAAASAAATSSKTKGRKAGAAAATVSAAADDAAAAAAAAAAADEAVVSHLLHLNPSALDLELRGLGGSGGLLTTALRLVPGQGGGASHGGASQGTERLPEGLSELRAVLHCFGRALSTGRDFELLQTVLAVFLRMHQETLAAAPELLPALRALHASQGSRWGTLREQLHGNLCLLSFLCRTRT
jgi:hypothetical protein